jgi:hypothetical protein
MAHLSVGWGPSKKPSYEAPSREGEFEARGLHDDTLRHDVLESNVCEMHRGKSHGMVCDLLRSFVNLSRLESAEQSAASSIRTKRDRIRTRASHKLLKTTKPTPVHPENC